MNLHQSFDEDFSSLITKLREEFPAELLFLTGIHQDQTDMNKVTKDFFKRSTDKNVTDVSIDPNANVGVNDVVTYVYEANKPFLKLNSLYNLWKILKEQHSKDYADSCITAEVSGGIYINDAWDIGRPYCFNFTTLDIALEGLRMSERLEVKPPKSLATFLRQVEQFVSYAANSTLGATGLADLLITASWYVDKIKINDYYDGWVHVMDVREYVTEQFAHLIYTLNWDFFRGNQSPFTNISLYDDKFLESLAPSYLIEGVSPKIETIKMVQEIFLDTFNEELRRTQLTFPVVTACLSVNEDNEIQDREFLEEVCKANLEFGFINFYTGTTSTISSCCRLRSNVNDLGYSNTFGAGSTKIGSLGVVTLNLPRLAREANRLNGDRLHLFFHLLKVSTAMVSDINHAKRLFIEDRIARGALPLYDLGYMSLSHQYSTCGFTGLYETLEILGFDMNTEEGKTLAWDILDTINEENQKQSKLYGTPHNMEQVPAESSSVKLAKKDSVLGLNPEGYELYSNQFLPLTAHGVDLLDRIDIQGYLDPACTGGAICHLNIGERITDYRTLMSLVSHASSKGVVYFAVNYMLGKCKNKHMSVVSTQKDATCSVCGEAIVDTFTRVVGFLTNTKNWNRTRREYDLPQRVFTTPKAVSHEETSCVSV